MPPDQAAIANSDVPVNPPKRKLRISTRGIGSIWRMTLSAVTSIPAGRIRVYVQPLASQLGGAPTVTRSPGHERFGFAG
jgi:hypothetical protein